MNDFLRPYDVLHITRCLPKVVVDVLKLYPKEVFLAGGFIRACIANEEISDVDLIVANAEKAKMVADILKVERAKGGLVEHRTVSTANAYTILGYKYPIQVIHRWTYATVEDAIQSFDFTIACAGLYWDGSLWRSTTHPDYYADLASKRLSYTSPVLNEDAGGSMLRVLKFYQRGYRIPLDSLGSVIARLTQSIRVGSLATVDEAQAGRVITGLLREVDPAVDPDHIAHLPSTTPTDTTPGA
jgi:hypothetical protein